ncbi:MAG: septation regulator SpoVG [Ruminococcaceae bacterium]|nr:septation regulator SpoVG [Oscillospiraceae bacterium]
MKITGIKIRRRYTEGTLRAIVSVTFDDCFAVHDIKVVCTMDRYFVVMPSKQNPDGTFRDIAHPINTEFRREIEKAVMDEYNKEPEEASASETVSE